MRVGTAVFRPMYSSTFFYIFSSYVFSNSGHKANFALSKVVTKTRTNAQVPTFSTLLGFFFLAFLTSNNAARRLLTEKQSSNFHALDMTVPGNYIFCYVSVNTQ